MDKVYTIGRDESCDIVIEDATDVVSRMHAVLKDKGKDKYVLVDHSRNGTYVNGIKMNPNEEVPVTRKDTISLAHAKDLDWSLIPQPKSAGRRYTIIGLTALFVVVIAVALYFVFASSPQTQEPQVDTPTVTEPEPAPQKADTAVVATPVSESAEPAHAMPQPEQKQQGDNSVRKPAKAAETGERAKPKPAKDPKPQAAPADKPAKKNEEPPAKNDDDPVINPIF